MEIPPLLEAKGFFFWNACFNTYVKSKDIDLRQVIQNGDLYFEVEDSETKMMKETSYELFKDEQKKQLGKNNESKLTLYNALPCKEYVRVFMCKISKEVYEMVLDNDGIGSKTTKEKVKSLALKAKVNREQTSDDNDSQ
uniref:Zf-CCHC domain-containing protein/DUF4219 domain-containing protein/UBN2 domain-containing protein n=1 Tax=Tanacetum cinerariifolium TaxID=118510 RepID=A0A6L2JEY0_TANCI|nr:hypothetical protein [Tanacetum cinerariifolium]